MKHIAIKVIVSITLLLLSNQALSANYKSGHGNSGSRKSQRPSSHSVHRQKSAFRGNKPYTKSRHSSSHRKPGYYKPGHRTHYLPRGYSRVFYGKKEYFYFDGYFYSPFRNDYHIIDAPIGVIILSLPRLHFALQWNGVDYFLSGNTYYRRHPNGYIVVRNPGFRNDWR